MFLKSLELHGFKSFADRTKFEFHEGVTGIVGPNGCGKSNVVDAIRWVLGETSAKALRGGEMADVIFNGTDKRQALGMAEVVLTLSNCKGMLDVEFNEVSIGRRVYKDGKSEYLLNRKACRLKDIQNLLMGTGIGRTSYSIMEQGKIDMLLSSKPEDRRAVFEEAAGITKYKAQKKEALRKLDYVEANLLRHADIIAELKRQMGSLQRQSAKARRYQALHTDLKVLDLHLSHRNFREYRAERSELETSVNQLRESQATLEKEIEAKQAEITTARDEFQNLESQVSGIQQAISAKQNEVRSAQSRMEFNTERAQELSALITQNEADIASTTEKLSQQEADLKQTEAMLADIQAKIEEQTAQVSGAEQNAADIRQERQELDTALGQAVRERNQLEGRLSSLETKIAGSSRQLEADQQRHRQLEDEIQRLQQEIEQKSGELKGFQQQLDELRETIAKHEEELRSTEEGFDTARRDLAEVERKLAELFKTHSEKVSRLDVLKQLVADGEGFEKGTQAVLKGLDQPDVYRSTVRGALASFMEVEEKFIRAMEAALGHNLQAIVVSDDMVAESIIDALKTGDYGRAAIVSEESVAKTSQRQLMSVPEGAIAWALDKVQCQDRICSLMDLLLRDVLLVDTLSTALKLRPDLPGVAMATLDGELVTAEGIIRGGSGGDEAGSILKRQAEIRELELVNQGLEEELTAAAARKDEIKERVTSLENRVEAAREKLQEKRVSFSTLEGQCSLMKREIQQIESKLESQTWEQQEVTKRREALAGEIAKAEEEKETTSARLEELAGIITESESNLELIREKEANALERLNEIRTALAVERRALVGMQDQRAPMDSRMAELRELLERRNGEIASFGEKITRGEEENQALTEKIDETTAEVTGLESELSAAREDRAARRTAIDEAERVLSAQRRQVNEFSEQRTREEIKSTQIDLRIENLEASIRERYQTDLDRFEPDSHALLAAIQEQKNARSRNAKRRATIEAKNAAEEGGGDGEEQDSPDVVADASTPETPEEDFNLADEAEPDWDFVEEVVAEIRSRLDSMGPVNLDAIEEYEELEERYKFQEEHHDDLVQSKEKLLKVISQINRETKRMFQETFETVRGNFKDMFQELFGPLAKADLMLVDESDPLECGIDIIAKPPGKKLQSISLLSGGERSMTAVALLFAIYMVKPSPFCVLDELDAPLDESNIGRFIKVLDRFIADSQFIIVTHSKRTMSRADVMYGVSMQEFGVSKTVGMKFSQSDGTESTKTVAEAVSQKASQ